MSGFLFLLAMDWVMRRTTDANLTGIRRKFTSKLKDLDFADDVALMGGNNYTRRKRNGGPEEQNNQSS